MFFGFPMGRLDAKTDQDFSTQDGRLGNIFIFLFLLKPFLNKSVEISVNKPIKAKMLQKSSTTERFQHISRRQKKMKQSDE